jgi:hypothetical protein
MRKNHHTLPPEDGRDWRPVPGFAGMFASADGQIWSGKTGTLKLQRGSSNGKGYRAVWLWVNGRDRERRVHQLVTLAFHGLPPSSRHTPDHINRDRSDNRAENLRWACPVTQGRNTARTKNWLGQGHWSSWLALPG